MSVHAFTETAAAPVHTGVEGVLESLFASQRRSSVENRAKFTLKARLAMLSRLCARILT